MILLLQRIKLLITVRWWLNWYTICDTRYDTIYVSANVIEIANENVNFRQFKSKRQPNKIYIAMYAYLSGWKYRIFPTVSIYKMYISTKKHAIATPTAKLFAIRIYFENESNITITNFYIFFRHVPRCWWQRNCLHREIQQIYDLICQIVSNDERRLAHCQRLTETSKFISIKTWIVCICTVKHRENICHHSNGVAGAGAQCKHSPKCASYSARSTHSNRPLRFNFICMICVFANMHSCEWTSSPFDMHGAPIDDLLATWYGSMN